jgi:Amt family ammonium transporter
MYALILGKRNDPVAKSLPKYKPHSVTSVVLGVAFLWFGWFGFNGGSAGNATIRAWFSCLNTNVAAAVGGLTWMFVDYFRYGGLRGEGKWTTVGLCSGVVAGLVAITPAAGFVPVWASVIIGFLGAVACNFAVDIKGWIGIDDGVDVWALHGVGGAVGAALTGIFAADYVAALDGSTENDGGWLNHNYVQLGYQLAGLTSVAAYSSVVTALILLIMDRIPFLKLRLSAEEEELGTDEVQIGEFTYLEETMYIPEPVISNKSAKVPPMNAIDDQIATDATSQEKKETV